MKNQEMINKLDALVSKNPSKWVEESNFRLENKDRIRYSQQVAVRILRTLRERNLKQKDLADMLGVTPQTVNKWVKGSENFTFETIDKIEKALKIKLMYIYESNDIVIINSSTIVEIKNEIKNELKTILKDIQNTFVVKKETKVIPINEYINEEECFDLNCCYS